MEDKQNEGATSVVPDVKHERREDDESRDERSGDVGAEY